MQPPSKSSLVRFFLTSCLLLVGLWWSQTVVLAAALPHQPIRQADHVDPASLDTFAWVGAVYQSSRSGNWELYYVPFMEPEVQLTNHPAADTLPRLNRGSTHVAFVSARDGNAEIYTIKIDGTGLTRLTTNSVEDTLPYWSPDGRQLIFSSQRTGNGDLYLMNADGSGLRQLTSDPAEDTYPTWSPDGAQLLWVRLYPVVKQQPQEGELWVADANGANARALTGRLRLPARPLISPNGALIALDADLDQNGRPDLVLMDRNTGNAYTFAPSDVGLLRWMGTWSHDSSTLWVTKLTYQVLENGQWILISTEIEQLCLDNRPGCSSLISGDQRAMMPDRQLADLGVPVSQVDPLPPYSRLKGFLLSWSGKEYGPAGLIGFDIQYRLAGEAEWQPFWWGTGRNPDIRPQTPNPETGAMEFKPAETGLYYFRSRTRDYADNYEPWPASDNGDTSTRVFSWYLAGQVTDGRGVPYAQQELALAPAALEPALTDRQGNFQVHIGPPGEYTLAGAYPLKVDRDRTFTYYQLPPDNLMQNGGFEAALAPSNWQISGTATVVQNVDLVHTGVRSLQLGRPCPADCLTTIPNSGLADLDFQTFVIDPAGNLHLFARKAPGTLIHQLRTPDGRWLPYVALANGIANWTPAFVFDHRGDLHFVWSSLAPPPADLEETLYYARYRAGQGWSQPEKLGQGGNPKVVIDAQQQLHVVALCTQLAECLYQRMSYYRRSAAGGWTAPRILNTNDYLTEYTIGAVDNGIQVAWVERDLRRTFERLYTASLPADGRLRNPQLLNRIAIDAGDAYYHSPLHFRTDHQGTLHLAWTIRNEANVYYTHRPRNGAWQPIEMLRAEPESSGIGPLIPLLDANDTLHLWAPRHYTLPLLHWQRTVAGLWLPVQSLNLAEGRSQSVNTISLDPQNTPYFGLSDAELGFLLKTTAVVTTATTSRLHQSLAIPATLQQPTLSFLYQMSGGRVDSALAVLVSEGMSTTTVFSTTTASGWQLGWADLTPWQGKAITVTFQTREAVGEPYLQVALDQVTLGSWRTPVPQQVTPNQLPWGIASSLTITGSNFMATPQVYLGARLLPNPVWQGDHTLTVNTPADLPPGRHELWVVNPTGERMLLASGVIVGRQFYLPLVQR